MKLEFSFSSLGHNRGINIIPFSGSVIINGKVDSSEILANVLVFIPFGIYICMLKQEWSFIKKIAPIFITSLIFETLQFFFAIGATDITDLIGNTLGGIIGIGVFYVFLKAFKAKSYKIINIIAFIATGVMVAFMELLIALNI